MVGPIEVFVARKIITLNEGWPEGTAVAVADGRIVSVGSEQSLKPWLKGKKHNINRTFEDKVLVPGFIDPHMHPLIGGMASSLPCLAYYDQPNPYGKGHKGLKTQKELKRRLKELLSERRDEAPDKPVLCWGYDQVALGGHLDKEFFRFLEEGGLPKWCRRPVAIWDASMHYCYCNDAMVRWAGVSTDQCKKVGTGAARVLKNAKGEEEPAGCFLGNHAAGLVLAKLLPVVATGDFLVSSMKRIVDLSMQSGCTTISELGLGLVDLEQELKLFPAVFNDFNCPVRCVSVTLADAAVAKFKGNTSQAVEWVTSLRDKESTDRLMHNGVKFFTDDAFVGLTMQMCCCPGYIDGHKGIWLSAVGKPYVDRVLPWWTASHQIHVHSNGDAGQDATLDLLIELQRRQPRFDHRFSFEHYGVSTVAHARKVKALGAVCSVNIYYPYLRGELNEEHLGTDRAHMASRLGTLKKYGIPTALHTDTPIAPPRPLEEIWIAVNRFSQSGRVLAPAERVSPMDALRMVTIDAAYILQKDHEIGSIEVGKFADFTVLNADPLSVDPRKIRDIEVLGTVMNGRVFKAGHTWRLGEGPPKDAAKL